MPAKAYVRIFLFLIISLFLATTAFARSDPPRQPVAMALPSPEVVTTFGAREDTLFLFAASGPGSYGSPGTDARGYTFDHAGGPAEAGWFGVDLTAQEGLWWHLADTDLCVGTGTDMSEALPFDTGDTVNDYALWCGRSEVCGWEDPDGYGSNWSQYAVLDLSAHLAASEVVVDFAYRSDFEGGSWDWFEVRVDSAGTWKTVHQESAGNEQTYRELTFTIPAAEFGGGATRIGFYFQSDDAWDDEDGSFNSDLGAVWIDNIVATVDGAQVFAADFEDGLEPAELSFEGGEAAGNFATLRPNMFQEDLCIYNSSHVWTFFDLDTTNPEYPMPVIAYGPPYVHNVIESPLLEVDQNGAPFVHEPGSMLMLTAWIYHDNPLESLVIVEWPSIAAWRAEENCLGKWVQQDITTYPPEPFGWERSYIDLGYHLTESADGSTITGFKVRAGGVRDMCSVWCGPDEYGSDHASAPFMDTISIWQTTPGDATGYVLPLERFQDSFPEPSGKVRIDAAHQLNDPGDPFLAVGDSTTIFMNMDGSGGLAATFNADAGELRPELHLYWRVSAGPHQDLVEAAQADPDNLDGLWSPFTGIASLHGLDWGTMQADSCTGYGGNPNWFSFDFSDVYFEPGDIIEFFYRAESENGTVVSLPEWAMSSDPDLRETYRVRCLPTAGHGLLMVEDDMDTSTSWQLAFEYNCCTDYDVYSRQAPGSGLHNGLGCRAEIGQLSSYEVIIWDSGNLDYSGMSAPGGSQPCADTPLLEDWLTNTNHDVGMWVMGNGIAKALDNSDPDFLHQVFGVESLSSHPYSDVTGIRTPLVYASHQGLEIAGLEPYFRLDGGCPSPEDYDVVGLTGAFSEESHRWQEDGGWDMVAGAYNRDPDGDGTHLNAAGYRSRVLFNPFSYDQVIHAGFDPGWELYYVRSMVGNILVNLFGFPLCGCTPAGEVPPVTALNGAYPNPFNPSTTIRFSLAEAGPVELRIYDLSGRRIRSLIDGRLDAGAHEFDWKGRDDAGHVLASGVYFLLFKAGETTDTGKLILLK